MKKIATISVAVLCLSAMASAVAAKPGFYLGAGLGASSLDTPNRYLFDLSDEEKDAASLVGFEQSRKKGGLGGRVFGGYNFNPYFGVEAGVAKYANSSYQSNTTGDIYKANLDYSLNALDLVAKAYLPLGESGFSLYALGGAAYVNSKVKFKDTLNGVVENNGHTTTSKLRPKYGVGASYDIPETNFGATLEYSQIKGKGDLNKSDKAIPNADLLTLNFTYNFN